MNMLKIRALRWIRRFNYHACVHYQTVAEHSFFVALLAYEFALVMRKDAVMAGEIIHGALLHDVTEAITGDLPFLVQRKMQDVEADAREELGMSKKPIERSLVDQVIDLADVVELKLYLQEEYLAGNVSLQAIEEETMGRIEKLFEEIGNGDLRRYVMSLIQPTVAVDLPRYLSHTGERYE